jgi:hypothetical protein
MPLKDPKARSKYQSEWLKRRRKDWLEENGPCKKCRSNHRLEVHHIDRSKKVSHRIWGWKEVDRRRELAKCMVLCHECHKEQSKIDGRAHLKHGMRGMYTKVRCRCELCRKANADYARRWNRSRAVST